jgi:hypothetical protein
MTGGVTVGVPSDPLLPVGLRPGLVHLLRLGRAPLEEPDGRRDVEEELEVLRLPVLRHVDAEVGGHEVFAEADLGESFGGELVVEVGVARDRLSGEGQQESDAEGQSEAVVPQEAAGAGGLGGACGHRCISPTALK